MTRGNNLSLKHTLSKGEDGFQSRDHESDALAASNHQLSPSSERRHTPVMPPDATNAGLECEQQHLSRLCYSNALCLELISLLPADPPFLFTPHLSFPVAYCPLLSLPFLPSPALWCYFSRNSSSAPNLRPITGIFMAASPAET